MRMRMGVHASWEDALSCCAVDEHEQH